MNFRARVIETIEYVLGHPTEKIIIKRFDFHDEVTIRDRLGKNYSCLTSNGNHKQVVIATQEKIDETPSDNILPIYAAK